VATRRHEEQVRLAVLQKQEEAKRRLEEEARRRLEDQLKEQSARAAESRAVVPKPSPQAERLAKAEGALVRGDYAGAREILLPLAQGGNTQAQTWLAGMYASGQGASRNYFQAYIWYSLAARGGSTTAPAERDRIARLMQPAEVKQADEVVDSMRAP